VSIFEICDLETIEMPLLSMVTGICTQILHKHR
jgi:hypothetical protein